MQLNCKVIKKVATPHFYINPSFSRLSPVFSKMFGTLQVAQFLERPTRPPSPHFFNKGVGGVPTIAYWVKMYAAKHNFVQNYPTKTISLILLSYILFLLD